jgi:hypothetical protein
MDIWGPYVKKYFDWARSGVEVDAIAYWESYFVGGTSWAAEGSVVAANPPSGEGSTRLLLEGDLLYPTESGGWGFQPMHLRVEHIARFDQGQAFARTLTTVHLQTTNESRELDDPVLYSTMYGQAIGVMGVDPDPVGVSVSFHEHWLDLLIRFGLTRARL